MTDMKKCKNVTNQERGKSNHSLIKGFSFHTFFSEKPIYLYLPTPPFGQDMTQGQFLSGVWQVWIQSFPSSRLVATPRLKNSVCPTIYP